MQVTVVAVGHRMPDWIESGYREYAKRMPPEWHFGLKELKPIDRSSSKTAQTVMAGEAAKILSVIPKNARIIALDEHGKPLLNANGKTVLRKSYSVLQDDFFAAMRKAGYDDVERGERGSSEEHLTVTQFKVQQEQARLAEFTEQNRQQEKQAATLGSKIEKIQNQRVDVRSIEKIVATSIPFSSKVAVEREDFDRLSTLAKKYVTAEKKESKLQKALDAASKLIAKLKAEIDSLKQEISDYKSVHSKLRAAELERENTELRGKVRSYEDVIQRNNLWRFFHPRKEKAVTRDEAR